VVRAGAALSPLLAAVADGAVRMINPFVQVVAQSKKGMAFWFERGDLLTADERALVEAHLPGDEPLPCHPTPRVPSPEGRDRRQARLRPRRRAGADRLDVHEGGVARGARVAMSERASGSSGPLRDAPRRIDGEALYPCHGAYVVADRFAGFYRGPRGRPSSRPTPTRRRWGGRDEPEGRIPRASFIALGLGALSGCNDNGEAPAFKPNELFQSVRGAAE